MNLFRIFTLCLCFFVPLAFCADKKILIVLTNHSELADTGKKTGYFLSEVSHPYSVFKEAGYEVDFASPEGGLAPMDPKSRELKDPLNKKFVSDVMIMKSLTVTLALSELELSNYSAIFFAGGHGTMWDFATKKIVKKTIKEFNEQKKIIGAVCHGPAAFVDVFLKNGEPLLKGKNITGFSNEEEERVKLKEAVPFLLETKLKEQGAQFSKANAFKSHVVVDENIVTGQNPASAKGVAEKIIERLSRKAL